MEIFRADAGVVGAVDEAAAAGDARTGAARGDEKLHLAEEACIITTVFGVGGRGKAKPPQFNNSLWNQQAWTDHQRCGKYSIFVDAIPIR